MKVAIVGAGIAGLTAALALKRIGAQVSIFEQAPDVSEIGAGIQVSPNAWRVLKAIDVAEALDRRATIATAIELRNGKDGDRLATLDVGELAPRRYGEAFRFCRRAALVASLHEACRRAGIAIELGARVVAPGDGRGLSLADGREVGADLIVAADGIRSGVRDAVLGTAQPKFSGTVAYRALVQADDDAAVARNWMAAGKHVVTYPVPGGGGMLTNIVAVRNAGDPGDGSWVLDASAGDVQAGFSDMCAQVTGLLDRVEQVRKWGLYHLDPLPVWHRSRLVVVGDAAHAMLPHLSQGACMAIEDGWVLAASLAAAREIGAGLAAYEAARRPRATRVAAGSLRNGQVYRMGGAMAAARNAYLAAMDRVSPGRLLARYDWIYRHDCVGEFPLSA